MSNARKSIKNNPRLNFYVCASCVSVRIARHRQPTMRQYRAMAAAVSTAWNGASIANSVYCLSFGVLMLPVYILAVEADTNVFSPSPPLKMVLSNGTRHGYVFFFILFFLHSPLFMNISRKCVLYRAPKRKSAESSPIRITRFVLAWLSAGVRVSVSIQRDYSVVSAFSTALRLSVHFGAVLCTQARG